MTRGMCELAVALVLAGVVAAPAAAELDREMDREMDRGGALVAGADIGRIEYMTGCAQCHGTDGRGDGIIADYLSVAVPDLTAIQRDNEGVFPAGVIFEIIEGGRGIGAHGTREMPAWGDRYSAEAYAVLGWPHEPEEREAFVRGRILALVEYLARIQAD